MEMKEPTSVFHPGEYIRDELTARGWSQAALASILGWRPSVVQDILKGTRLISLDMAKALGAAFGTSPQLWINLQTAYQLAISPKREDAIERKARMFGKYPIKELQTRGWLAKSDDAETLERDLCEFLDVKSLDDEVTLKHAARKSDDYTVTTPVQQAWLARAKHLARNVMVDKKYTDDAINSILNDLSQIRSEPESVRHVPQILSKHGVRLVIVQGIKKSLIDGACFWIDERSPCVVLSLRYDRIDAFWFNLMHELGHVKHRHGDIVDTCMFGEDGQTRDTRPQEEQLADDFAESFLIDKDRLNSFVARHHPLYSKLYVMAFALQNEVHPGIVVGQLQHRGKLPWTHLRGLLVKIRTHIITTALTDGWGNVAAL